MVAIGTLFYFVIASFSIAVFLFFNHIKKNIHLTVLFMSTILYLILLEEGNFVNGDTEEGCRVCSKLL